MRGAHRAVRHMRLYLLLLSVQLVLCGAFTAQSANSPPDSSPETAEALEQGHAAGVAEVERLFYGVEHNQADGLDPMDDALTL